MASAENDEPLVAGPNRQKDGATPDLEGGHLGDGWEEEAGAEHELRTTRRGEPGYNGSTIEGGTTGPEDDVEEEEEDSSVEGERQQGDSEEGDDASGIADEELDGDEDCHNPQYIPRKGEFYQHDDRVVGDGESSEVRAEKKEDNKSCQKTRTQLRQGGGAWTHDLFIAEEQSPKTKEELVEVYGYDIRSGTMPPHARGRQRYSRGPNRYQRNWEDENATSARLGFGRGGGGPSFRDEDFPDLKAKPSSSEGAANQGWFRRELPADEPFKVSERCTSPLRDWEHADRSLGRSRRGWGKHPQAPRRASGGSPKPSEDELAQEVALLSVSGGSKAVPQSPLKTSEPLLYGAASKAGAGDHVPTEREGSVHGAEVSDKLAYDYVRADVQEGGDGADPKITTVFAASTWPQGSTETTARPKRYSSLRQRPIIQAASDTQDPGVVAPQTPSRTQAPPAGSPSPAQPVPLTPAHFQRPPSPHPAGRNH
ncbi:uncharacterized protein LOC144172945 isoform X1 [Haemaphysalis longicornis]